MKACIKNAKRNLESRPKLVGLSVLFYILLPLNFFLPGTITLKIWKLSCRKRSKNILVKRLCRLAKEKKVEKKKSWCPHLLIFSDFFCGGWFLIATSQFFFCQIQIVFILWAFGMVLLHCRYLSYKLTMAQRFSPVRLCSTENLISKNYSQIYVKSGENVNHYQKLIFSFVWKNEIIIIPMVCYQCQ